MPARLTRLSELRSCGKASKGAHLGGLEGEEVHHQGASASPVSVPPQCPQLQLHPFEI